MSNQNTLTVQEFLDAARQHAFFTDNLSRTEHLNNYLFNGVAANITTHQTFLTAAVDGVSEQQQEDLDATVFSMWCLLVLIRAAQLGLTNEQIESWLVIGTPCITYVDDTWEAVSDFMVSHSVYTFGEDAQISLESTLTCFARLSAFAFNKDIDTSVELYTVAEAIGLVE